MQLIGAPINCIPFYLFLSNNTPATTGPISITLIPHARPTWEAITPTSKGKKLVIGESNDVTLNTTPDFPGCAAYACPLASGYQSASTKLNKASITSFTAAPGSSKNSAKLIKPSQTLTRNSNTPLIYRSTHGSITRPTNALTIITISTEL